MAEVPRPVFCAVTGVAASALAVVTRPQVGLGRAVDVLLDAALVTVVCAAIAVHARLSSPEENRPRGLEPALLPVATMASLFTALAGTDSPFLMGVATAGCAGVLGTAPHLDALRAARREGSRERVLRDVAGTLVMVPAALAGASDALGSGARASTVLVLAALSAAEAIRPAPGRRTLVTGLPVGAVTGAGTLLAVRAGSQATGAAGLLLLWYGLRGLAASLATRRGERLAVLEYLAVAIGAGALLVTQAHLQGG